jgi:hypothetical protein
MLRTDPCVGDADAFTFTCGAGVPRRWGSILGDATNLMKTKRLDPDSPGVIP